MAGPEIRPIRLSRFPVRISPSSTFRGSSLLILIDPPDTLLFGSTEGMAPCECDTLAATATDFQTAAARSGAQKEGAGCNGGMTGRGARLSIMAPVSVDSSEITSPATWQPGQ